MYPLKVKLQIILFLGFFHCKLADAYSFQHNEPEWMLFPDGDGVPRLINLLPSNSTINLSLRRKREVEFRLYAKDNTEDYIILNEDTLSNVELSMKESIHNYPLKVITHGWMSTADKSSVMNLVDAYLQAHVKVNVIAIDWSSYAMNYLYTSVADETKEVGRRVAHILDILCDQFNITGEQIHLIGHSLGAHVMGIAGFNSKVRIGRITGLDPALPLFKSIEEDKSRLDYGDAMFVDVIHTCGGVLGFWDAVGKADFYPNNGRAPQPGCDVFNIFQFEACSHGRSIIYFAESILNPEAFPSYKCDDGWNLNLEKNCVQSGYMGERASWNMSGIFYLKTNSETPFGKGFISTG